MNWRKIGVTVVGPVIIIVGIALLVLPGPGLVTIGVGLALMGTEYHWARRLIAPIRRRLQKEKQRPPEEND